MGEKPAYEVLREVYRITERRDGDVYRTEYVETRWVDEVDTKYPPRDIQYVVISDPEVFPTVRRKQSPA